MNKIDRVIMLFDSIILYILNNFRKSGDYEKILKENDIIYVLKLEYNKLSYMTKYKKFNKRKLSFLYSVKYLPYYDEDLRFTFDTFSNYFDHSISSEDYECYLSRGISDFDLQKYYIEQCKIFLSSL